jgi:hypothetical protein
MGITHYLHDPPAGGRYVFGLSSPRSLSAKWGDHSVQQTIFIIY